MNETIGSRIKAARKRAGMTQGVLAKKIGLNQSDVSKYEQDRARVTAEVIERIALATGTSVSVLYGTMMPSSDDCIIVSDKYNSLNATGKKRLCEYLDELIQLYPK